MSENKIIESLKHSSIPEDEESKIIFKLMDENLDSITILLNQIFNYGKQQGIRLERAKKIYR